jgi:ABC-type branched-subunit amino acid transport system substrate-binding protein
MKKFLLSLCMVLALAACKEEKKEQAVDKKPVVNIGITLPLTGDAADAGQTNKKVIELALKEFGDTKYQYNLYFEDDMTAPKKAMLNAVNFTDTKKATAILSMWTPAGMAVSPIADKNKAIHITCAWGYDVAKGKYNFNSSTSFESQVNLLIKKLKEENLTNIAYMVVNTSGCEEQSEYAIPVMKKAGINFTDIQYYNPTETDFRMLISKMEAKHPDYYVLCGIPPSSQIFAQQLQEVTHKRNITSIDTFFEMDPSAWPLVDGLWFVNSASGTPEFANKIKSELGETPKSCTANLYDAAHLLIWAYENAPLENGETIPNTDNIVAKLHEVKNYDGGTGTDLWIDKDGILQSQAVLKKIENNKLVDVEE